MGHAILSIVHPDDYGNVDVRYFLRVCCTVVPHMFDTTAFMDKAGTIAKDKADALVKQELEELQGFSSSLAAAKRRGEEEDQEEVAANAPDKEAVEKALIHVGNQYEGHGAGHRQAIDRARFLEAMRHEQVNQCMLSEHELRGFIAEAILDDRGEIAYVDHIKTWVPIIFELRKSRAYDTILNKDWGLDANHLVDLSSYDAQFPILVETVKDTSRPGSSC